MLINSGFEIGYPPIAFAMLGIILIGALLACLHLDRWHPKLIGAIVGALIEFLPMLT
ncbi:conserved protein of unknown function [Burkholderia multivorans]